MMASLLHLQYTSFEASTHLVVLVIDIAMGIVVSVLIFFILECVLIWSVFMCHILVLSM